MKNILTVLSLAMATATFAQEAQLVVQQVDNQNAVPGQTFRVYAEVPQGASIHAIYGLGDNESSITTTGQFYQNELGGATAEQINDVLLNIDANLAYDSYITIGETNSALNNLWNVNLDLDAFESGAGFQMNEGAWFLLPENVSTKEKSGLVLLAQLTTTGVASGEINVQGWDVNGETFKSENLTFSTTAAQIFGCTDVNAPNYNASATYDNGTCEVKEEDDFTHQQQDIRDLDDLTDPWQVFPNPVFNGEVNIQFAPGFINSDENVLINVFDTSGKLVATQSLAAEQVSQSNRYIMQHDLATGLYSLNILHANQKHTSQLVIK